jgi:hypothetical protein
LLEEGGGRGGAASGELLGHVEDEPAFEVVFLAAVAAIGEVAVDGFLFRRAAAERFPPYILCPCHHRLAPPQWLSYGRTRRLTLRTLGQTKLSVARSSSPSRGTAA